jgi:hypothetical protein
MITMAAAASEEQVQLSRGQAAAVVLSVGLGVVMAGYGLAGSYLSISELADRHDVPLAALVPAGIDGGLVAVVVLDLVLTWIGVPVGWLRQLVRVLSVGTVVVNAVAGWPNLVAVGLHCAAPLMLLVMLEAGRCVLLRRLGEARGTRREPIPLIRWLLAPWRTLLLWRRMALWQITSYRTAIDTELALRRAVTQLRAHHGRRWRRHASADLVWMLRTGVSVNEAVARVQRLVGIDHAVETTRSMLPDTLGASLRISTERNAHATTDQASAPASAFRPEAADVNDDRFAEAMRLNRQHWMDTGRPISAETLRQRLHVGADVSRGLVRAVREADRAAVIAVASPS